MRFVGEAEFLADAVAAEPDRCPELSDTACAIFTSGTTGASKAVLMPWGQTAAFAALAPFEAPGEQVFFVPFSPFHLAGKGAATNVRFLPADLLDPRAAGEAFTRIGAEIGRVDALVTATHGGSTPTLLRDLPLANLGGLLANQVMSVFHACRAVLPIMQAQGSGSIVTIASDAAKVPTPGESVVGAAMSAITMFAKTMALEVKRDGVRVNIVSPSVVAGTETFERVMGDEFGRRLFAKIDRMAALGVPTPQDVATLVTFLAGPDAARVTGQSISINGGISTV